MRGTTKLVLVMGWLGYGLLPWYLVERASLVSVAWLSGYPFGRAGTALALALSGGAPWLLPVGLALLAATVASGLRDEKIVARILILAGAAGIALFFAQGFAIGIRGQGIPGLAALLGGAGAAQPGMGAGAFLCVLSLLLLLCHGLAYRRAIAVATLFVTSARSRIIVAADRACSCFFPVVTVLESAVTDQNGNFALVGLLVQPLTSIPRSGAWIASTANTALAAWPGTRCSSRFSDGVGTTLLGLACALLIAVRTGMPLQAGDARADGAADHHAALRHRSRADPALRPLGHGLEPDV
jgi:iron(III) transport system permease protein